MCACVMQDMDALQLMGDGDLLELGVTMLGPRKKMLHALEAARDDRRGLAMA
eukprot:COSAG01_NODE_3636_length_5844_cov_2.716623_2_plen_52_part_00